MISIIKIPFDKCIVEKERRGAALGPDAIETELKNFFEFEEKVSKKTKFLEIKEKNDFNKLHKEVEKIASNEYKKGNLVVGLGGDHSVSYGLMKAFAKKFQKPKPSEARLGPAKPKVSLGKYISYRSKKLY
ncbi:MAG: arginase family protein [DPANN group archaeon]|nr:arginase family protein [DPANN group archaeon]